jgi:hypothetical protein
MRSCFSFLLIPLFAFGVFPGRANTASVAVESEFSARLSYIQGDVRISLGQQEEPEIGKKWIDASAGMPMHAGYSLATQDGSAEIELENGSVIYLAPRSLLMFYELTTDDPDGTGTKEFDTARLKLLTGSVMFLSQFRMDGEFILETQTARLRSDRSVLFRVTSYLNTTEIVDLSQSLPAELLVQGSPSVLPPGKFADGKITVKAPEADTNDARDLQARERLQEREALTLAALRASGLSAPFGGLVDLYQNGKFAPCGANETCWEPSKQALAELATPASQSPAAAQPQRPVPGQIVSESEGWEGGACESIWTHTTVWRDRNGKLHRDKRAVNPGLRGSAPWNYAACTTGEFLYTDYRHRVVFKHDHCHHHHHHEGSVHWVRVNGRVGIARTLQNGAKGKSGVDWKSGVYLLPQKPGEGMKHSELSGTTKLALLHDAPKEYRGGWAQNALRVPQPTITAQFRDSHTGTTTASAGSPARGTLHQANYDYKARGFTVPGETKAGAGGHPVIVARMNSYGAVSAPTGRNSSPGAVPGLSHASHSSGGFSGSSGGSASHSSVGGASHSSGGGGSSSGGGAAHSSGGGSSSAASSASSAASAGAGSHH